MDVNRENYYRAPELPPKEARLSVGPDAALRVRDLDGEAKGIQL